MEVQVDNQVAAPAETRTPNGSAVQCDYKNSIITGDR
jgi:hypothetical protein